MIRLAAIAAALMLSVPAWAQDLKGVALVIGESKYETLGELVNPNQDARDIDDLLGDLGFDVDRVLNADAEELREAIDEFIEDAADADVALVYYSGHGIEVAGQNYIVPVDATFETPAAAGEALVAVQPMLEELAKAVPVTIVLLDACRSDPFPMGTVITLPDSGETVTISAEPGLAPVRGPTPAARPDLPPESLGTVIGFAAEPGQPALDGPAGENSPYAAALLKHLSAGGFSFGDVMTMVTEEVYLKTKAQQLPWTNSSLRRVLTFAAPEESDADQSAITSERRKLLLTIAGTPAETRDYVEALAGQEDVPLDALYGMLNVLGIKMSDAGGDIEQQLQSGAEKLKELISQRSTAVKADPELQRLSALADQAETEGAIALALRYRDEASAHADDLLTDKQEEAEQLRQDMIDIAQTYAANAATALLNFDHAKAAELYGKAYEAVKQWDDKSAFDFKINQADALLDRGYYTTDNDALVASLAAYQEASAMVPRDSAPLDWAKVEDRMGQTLQTLGERLASEDALQEALLHYEAALSERTQEAVPLDWAKSQNNFANALFSLGARKRDTAMLARSIEAFDASLRVMTPEAEPVRWATVANNRAASQIEYAQVVYMSTSEAELTAYLSGNTDPTNIPEVKAARAAANVAISGAVESVDRALQAISRDDNPLGWAMLRHTYATAVQQRGEMNHAPGDLVAAAEAYRDVLTVHTRDKTPAQWARSTNNLAITLKKLSDETSDPVPLREAIGLYREIIAMTPRENLPLDWADRQESLGNALAILADYDKSPASLIEALEAYRLAGEVTTIDRGVAKWQQLQTSISTTLLMQSLLTMDRSKAEEARDVAVAARDAIAAAGAPTDFYDAYLPQVDQVLALLTPPPAAP
jgi:uncharacterized caspase-like protein